MPRFVLLRHEMPPDHSRPSHWDLMLESGDCLRCWALYRAVDSPGPQIAEALADHRLIYLDYEGSVSGGRGTVTRDDHGEFEIIAEHNDEIKSRLVGQRLRGMLLLKRQDPNGQCWRLSFEPE